jgi:hypothetical protein
VIGTDKTHGVYTVELIFKSRSTQMKKINLSEPKKVEALWDCYEQVLLH